VTWHDRSRDCIDSSLIGDGYDHWRREAFGVSGVNAENIVDDGEIADVGDVAASGDDGAGRMLVLSGLCIILDAR
jgi:hypothetical protein